MWHVLVKDPPGPTWGPSLHQQMAACSSLKVLAADESLRAAVIGSGTSLAVLDVLRNYPHSEWARGTIKYWGPSCALHVCIFEVLALLALDDKEREAIMKAI